MKMHEEESIQAAVVDFLILHKIPFVVIGNQRKCTPWYGALLKRIGVRAGVSDLFLPRGNDIYKGVWIELKSMKGKPTKPQIEFLGHMIEEGYKGSFCYGLDETLLVIKEFYRLK